MPNRCYLCDRKSSSAHLISLHSFPKDAVLCKKWKDACALTDIDVVHRVYICSLHFCTDHVKVVGTGNTSRIYLFPNAIPMINVPNPPPRGEKPLTIADIYSTVDADKITDKKILGSIENFAEVNEDNIEFIDDAGTLEKPVNEESQHDDDATGVNSNSVLVSEPEKIIVFTPSQIYTDYTDGTETNVLEEPFEATFTNNADDVIDTDDNSSEVIEDSVANLEEDEASTSDYMDKDEAPLGNVTPKRRFFDPRYVSEITIADVATPKRRRRTLQLILKTDREKSAKIKKLQSVGYYLKKRLRLLTNLVESLKKERKLSKIVQGRRLSQDTEQSSNNSKETS